MSLSNKIGQSAEKATPVVSFEDFRAKLSDPTMRAAWDSLSLEQKKAVFAGEADISVSPQSLTQENLTAKNPLSSVIGEQGVSELFSSGGSESIPVATGADGSVVTAPQSSILNPPSVIGSPIPSSAGTMSTLGGVASLAAYLNNINEGGGKDIIRGRGKSDDYTNLALDINPVTAPINMGLRAFGLPSIGRRMKTGKSDEQQTRDDFRSAAKNLGIVGDDYNLKFSDGSAFDIGKDGGARLKNTAGKERNYFDVDWDNPLAASNVGRVQDLLNKKFGEAKNLGEQRTGTFVNAVTNEAKDQATVEKRIEDLAKQLGLSNSSQQKTKINFL